MQGGPFGEKISKKKFRKKCLAVPKKIERGDSLVSPGLVCYAEKQVKPFWFSSLDQIVHFGAIIFCRTFVELFWSVRVDRKKKRVTIIVAFHFMKRRLKTRFKYLYTDIVFAESLAQYQNGRQHSLIFYIDSRLKDAVLFYGGERFTTRAFLCNLRLSQGCIFSRRLLP